MKNIIIIGSRGFKSNYGGWETFVTNLIDNYNDKDTKFFVPELSHDKKNIEHIEKNVICTPIYVKQRGSITMMDFAYKAVLYYEKRVKEEQMKNVVMYILGCRVGPLFTLIHKRLEKLGIKILINPDGLEWTRDKWNFLIKQYFKLSERTMIKSSSCVVCDSEAIKNYVLKKYKKYNVKTKFIAYGAYLDKIENIKKANLYMNKYNLREKEYFLFVGRFVPENNIELIIKEYMKTSIQKDLVFVSNVEHNSFYDKLVKKTNFLNDKRIKFIGSIYDDSILRVIRKKCFAYIHGHSAGGTNPSLLEALSITDVNILYDVVYNREVGNDSCLYFNNYENNLKDIIEEVNEYDDIKIKELGNKAKDRIKTYYTWNIVVDKYKNLFDELL